MPYLNVSHDGITSRINTDKVGDISDLRRAIKEEYGDYIPAPPVAIQLYMPFSDEGQKAAVLVTEYEDIPEEYFKRDKGGGLFLEIRTSSPPTRQSSQMEIVISAKDLFVWREPERLVSASEAADWNYQMNPAWSDLSINDALLEHFRAWKRGSGDKTAHPILLSLSAPGTGKSRLLDELRCILLEHVRDMDVKSLVESAYVFKLTFENGTYKNPEPFDPTTAIGTRMLFQMRKDENISWSTFVLDTSNHKSPDEVLDILADVVGKERKELCVIIALDGMQKLGHRLGEKETPFYRTISEICATMNKNRSFIIAACSATAYCAVGDILSDSPQKRVFLTPGSLKTDELFGNFRNVKSVQLLIGDMGGHGRCLEVLSQLLCANSAEILGGQFSFLTFAKQVIREIDSKYPDLGRNKKHARKVFLHVIAGKKVSDDELVDGQTIDQIISYGFFRYNAKESKLECPYILLPLLAECGQTLWHRTSTWAPKYSMEDVQSWEEWKVFNCRFRALKSLAFDGEEVAWDAIHSGARFGKDCNFIVKERSLEYKIHQKRLNSKSPKLQNGTCSCTLNIDGICIQPASGSASGDSFICLESENGFRHEVHQYKRLAANIVCDDYESERKKGAAPHDLFMLYTTGYTDNDLVLPPLSGVVDKSVWEAYYGPFAARMYYVSTIEPPEINTAREFELLSVAGIGPKISQKICDERLKRPFDNLEDAAERVGHRSVLARLKF